MKISHFCKKKRIKISSAASKVKIITKKQHFLFKEGLLANVKKKVQQNMLSGIITINITTSNVIMNITNLKGQTIFISSAGLAYYKGSQKVKKYSIIALTKNLIDKACNLKTLKFAVHLKGLKRYRSLIIHLLKKRFIIKLIKQNSTLPHNGCRPKKQRRI